MTITAIAFTIAVSHAQNSMSINRISSGAAVINLQNSESVAGLQFTIRSSESVTLEQFVVSNDIDNEGFIVASHKINDSTMNVIILGSSSILFSCDTGPVGTVTFTTPDANSSRHMIEIINLVLVDALANQLHATSIPLEWNNTETATKKIAMVGNYPNPFNPATVVSFKLETSSHVRVLVYDISGREVARLADGYYPEGIHAVNFGASHLSSGIYVAQVVAGNDVVNARMILNK